MNTDVKGVSTEVDVGITELYGVSTEVKGLIRYLSPRPVTSPMMTQSSPASVRWSLSPVLQLNDINTGSSASLTYTVTATITSSKSDITTDITQVTGAAVATVTSHCCHQAAVGRLLSSGC